MPSISRAAKKERDQIALAARDVLSEPFTIYNAQTGTAPVSQRVYAVGVGLRAGDVVTNVLCFVTTAAAGTDPTSVKMGLYDSSGSRLGVTAELKADAKFDTVGVKEFALSSTYTVTADGLYYVAFLKDGTWGSTDLVLGRSGSPPQDPTVPGGAAPFAQESSQTDLDATVTLTVANALPFYLAVN